ncbi:hypothetical protein MKX01_015218 [Papaver californicum]|nr:hypothetical protein MKX01_015218 [Papaver californicum]
MGKVKQLGYAEDGGFEMKISGNVFLEDVKLGDSISVNVGLAPETLRKTSLIELVPGSRVNLERTLLPSTRMGRHVDGTVEIVSLECEGDSFLTVCKVFDDEECFNFMLVAYTQENAVIPLKKVGQKVNLEVDIFGKYVERLLQSGFISNITPI